MSKTLSANLLAEIQSEAPNIATCWKIARQDGVTLGFTDWPVEFDYLGLTYIAAGGYQRTAHDQKEGLNVDNMDIIGLIDSAAITEDDLLSNKYQDADVWIFLVSPDNLGWGEMKIDYGTIGQIQVKEQTYVAEFRSLTVRLGQSFGNKYSRYCRWELGDSNCGVILEPTAWAASTAYVVDDLVSPITPNSYQYICITPGTSGTYPSTTATTYVQAVDETVPPIAHWRLGEAAGPTAVDRKGSYNGTYNGTPTFSQTGLIVGDSDTCVNFDPTAPDSVSADYAGLDNLFHTGGSIEVSFSVDSGAVSGRIICKDAGTAVVPDNYGGWGLTYDSSDGSINFFQRFSDGVSVSSNARWRTNAGTIAVDTTYHVIITYNASNVANDPILYLNGGKVQLTEDLSATGGHTPRSDADAIFYIGQEDTSQAAPASPFDGEIDEVSLYTSILTANQAYIRYRASQNNFDDGEPLWNTTVGGITTEPTGVQWETQNSYTKAGTVTSVTSNYVFRDSNLTESAGWFKYGKLTWLTGDNAGVSYDIKESAADGTFTTRAEIIKEIQIGDTFKVSAGCNHILKMATDVKGSPYTGDCRAKFDNAANYGGEPELPNLDRVAAPASSI